MKSIVLPDDKRRILPFYLAAEEWIAANMPADDEGYFFAWRVGPTVICGRHQDIALEVDLDYARSHGIDVWRRKSGGGAVYADRNNVMFSLITSRRDVAGSFTHYTDRICAMLRSLGIEAQATGRNDIAIDGRKVAGNSCLNLPGVSIVHGTMLYDIDPETMARVLTPSRAKLESKGVQSVPSRVTTLREHGICLSCDDFVRHAIYNICTREEIRLGQSQIQAIEEIMQSYLDPAFLRLDDAATPGEIIRSARIAGVGELRLRFAPDASAHISNPRISGDFFPTGDVGSLERLLDGCLMSETELRTVLSDTDTTAVIKGLRKDDFIHLILSQQPI